MVVKDTSHMRTAMKILPIPNTLHMPETRGPAPRGKAATDTGNAAGQSVAAANVGKTADIIDTSNSPAKMAAAYLADLDGVSEYRNFGAVVSKFARGELPVASEPAEDIGAVDGVGEPEAGDPTTGETASTEETNPVVGDDVAAREGEGGESSDGSTAESDPVVEPEAGTEEDIVGEGDGEETTVTDIAEDVVVGDLEAALIDEHLDDETETV